MWRVYISSTYQDLKEPRRAVQDAILGLNHYPVGMESYAASDERPLNKCMKDVVSCDVYICVVAWRYGFCPDGGQKSITQLEYEAARDARIPRLVFLLDESAYWPRDLVPDREQTAVRRFRDLLSTETTRAQFLDGSDLSRRVTQALATAIVHPKTDETGTGVDSTLVIPDLLPYLCDRSDQAFALSGLLDDAAQFPHRPIVTIVHGDEREALDKFLERLQKEMLPKAINIGLEAIPVKRYRLEWPPTLRDRTDLHARLEVGLANAVLGSLRATRGRINERLAANLSIALIHSHVLSENFIQHEDLLNDFLSFWRDWPELQVGQLLFVSLFVKYQTSSKFGVSLKRSLRKQNDEIRLALNDLNFGPFKPADEFQSLTGLTGAVLPELTGSTLTEAQDWAARDQVSTFRDPQELMEELATFYGEWAAREKRPVLPIRIPTEDLAPKLREMLSRRRRIA
jgi:uncharacterized protein DUF4062/iSTAND domain-containing protein